MQIKGLHLNEIMDVYAFRIIVDDIDTCYRALGAIHQLFKPLSERFKDYIAIPKANNYQSLHTTLFGPYGMPIEVQIRTKEMNQQRKEASLLIGYIKLRISHLMKLRYALVLG